MKSDRTIRRRHPRGLDEAFGAPWGRAVKSMTLLGVLIILAAGVVPLLWLAPESKAAWVRWLALGILIIVFGGTSLFSVRGFTVNGRELLIQRTFWQTRFPLDELRCAYADPNAMKGSLRIAGNGGFLAFTGWFRSKRLGSYRAFVTDPARCVVLEFKNRTIVVSPDDPKRFAQALGIPATAESQAR